MIDVEDAVFDAVYRSVKDHVPEGCFESVYVPNPSMFPFATLMEMDNITDTAHQSNVQRDEYAVLTYEANVYAMSKLECRDVMNALDKAMIHLGFTRSFMQFIPNLADNTIFRYTARYRAAADHNNVIYRHA